MEALDRLESSESGVTALLPMDSELVVAGLVERRKADGRAVYSVAGKKALVALCAQPGVSTARVALANGLNANVLSKWINLARSGKLVGKKRKSARMPSLLAVQMSSGAGPIPKPPTSRSVHCELVLPRGTLRIDCEASALGALIEHLR